MARALPLLSLLGLLASLPGCSSTWVRHQEKRAAAEQSGNWPLAMAETDWLIENAMMHAPRDERSGSAEADRHLQRADYATRAGENKAALDSLRQALILDPSSAPSVRRKLARLPLAAAERRRIESEFSWNITALAPEEPLAEDDEAASGCWSYRVEEIRVRREQEVNAGRGRERLLLYDSRPWLFDAYSAEWRPEGDWRKEAGSESSSAEAPTQPRFTALRAANGGFLADTAVPPCHRGMWKGPFRGDGTLYIAPRLPASR